MSKQKIVNVSGKHRPIYGYVDVVYSCWIKEFRLAVRINCTVFEDENGKSNYKLKAIC